jgi:phosphoenolpyruvate phosphomutase / 2-hydroxyethylphosphonate cytidylyltransferase
MMKETPEQHRAAFIKQLKSTRLFNTKPTTMSFDEWRSIVKIGYVGMVGDLFHAGHLNVLQLAKVYCQIVVVGVLTDDTVRSYKRTPIINFEERSRIISLSRMVDIVIAQNTLSYRENLRFVRPNYLFHGKDWRTGVQATIRKEALEIMKPFEGVLIEPDTYEGVSTTEIIHQIKEHR